MEDQPKEMLYHHPDLTIVWKPHLCEHAGVCVRLLPRVYNPKERPWIKPLNATATELMDQINACPSGALSYRLPDNHPDRLGHSEF